MKHTVLAIAFSLVATGAAAHKVIAVGDGASMTLLVDKKPVKIRLANIEPPEKAQPFSMDSRKSLASLCLGKNAEYKGQEIDRLGRVIAVVTCGGIEANRTQVERGMAWVDKRNNDDDLLVDLQGAAKQHRKGLWAEANPVPPWEFRRPIRKVRAVSAENSDEDICFIGKRGEEYRIINGDRKNGC
jgi:micrococcal nuclease